MRGAIERTAVPDQASGLRRMLAPALLRMLPIAGGATRAVQAAFTACLARELAALGRNVVIVDQSHGDVPTEFGLRARYELSHALSGDSDWSRVLLPACDGVVVLPAARGLSAISGRENASALFATINGIWRRTDLVLLNLSAVDAALPLMADRGDWLMLIPTGSDGLMPAYRHIKRISHGHGHGCVRVLVCDAVDADAARSSFAALAATASRFLGMKLHFCAGLPGGISLIGRQGQDRDGGARQVASAIDSWTLATVTPERIVSKRLTAALSQVWS